MQGKMFDNVGQWMKVMGASSDVKDIHAFLRDRVMLGLIPQLALLVRGSQKLLTIAVFML